MKNLKRISTLIACIMMLSLCIPVFAIKEENTGGGGTNQLYIHKIDQTTLEKYLASARGEGTYTPGTTANTGDVLSSSAVIGTWTLTGGSSSDVTVANITDYENDINYDYGAIHLANIPFTITEVTPNSGKAGSASVSDYTTVLGSAAGSGITDTDGVLQFTGLTNGYYRVTETPNSTSTSMVDFIVALPYDPTGSGIASNIVHAYPKNNTNEGPDIDKEIPEINGNVISWKITADIPSTLNATMGSQVYKITDTLDSKLTLKTNTIDVYYFNGTSNVSMAATDYSVICNTDSNSNVTSFAITLTSDGYATLKNDVVDDASVDNKLYVAYDTVVTLTDTQMAVIDSNPVTNEVKLDFTNDTGTSYDSDKEITTDKLAGLKIVKQDGSDNTIKLAGAIFGVYTDDGANTALTDKNGTAITLTTGANGEIALNGLGAGTYYLKELTAPTGYKLLTGVITVEINDSHVSSQTVVTKTIDNYFGNGFTLPATGGTGTILFTIAGIALIAVAGLVFFVSRRKKNVSN